MPTKKHFAENRRDPLHSLIETNPLATLIVAEPADVVVDHFPLTLERESGSHGVLRGHVPIDNKMWTKFDGLRQAIAVFHGPQAYITPNWYSSKQEHGNMGTSFPRGITWSFTHTVSSRVIRDEDWLLQHLEELTDKHEAAADRPWKVSDAPQEFTSKMLRFIVGIEMPISSLDGKWKICQNRPAMDRAGVVAGLSKDADENSRKMLGLMHGCRAFTDP